jgi:hypothetical protein
MVRDQSAAYPPRAVFSPILRSSAPALDRYGSTPRRHAAAASRKRATTTTISVKPCGRRATIAMTKYPPIRIVDPDAFDRVTAQTPGSVRLAAIAPQLGIESARWGGCRRLHSRRRER